MPTKRQQNAKKPTRSQLKTNKNPQFPFLNSHSGSPLCCHSRQAAMVSFHLGCFPPLLLLKAAIRLLRLFQDKQHANQNREIHPASYHFAPDLFQILLSSLPGIIMPNARAQQFLGIPCLPCGTTMPIDHEHPHCML